MCSIFDNIIQCTISRITWCALSLEILCTISHITWCALFHYTMYNFTITWCALSLEILYNVQFHI